MFEIKLWTFSIDVQGGGGGGIGLSDVFPPQTLKILPP